MFTLFFRVIKLSGVVWIMTLFLSCSESDDITPDIDDQPSIGQNPVPTITINLDSLKSTSIINFSATTLSLNGNVQSFTSTDSLTGFLFNSEGGGINCDPEGDFLQIDSIGPIWEEGLTVTAWVTFDDARNFERIIDFGNGRGPDFGQNIALSRRDTSNSIVFSHWINSNQSDVQGVTAFDVITTGQSIFVAASISGEGLMSIYVNGELKNQNDRQPLANVGRHSNFIGRSNWCELDPDFKGIIEDLNIFNYELSQDAVLELFKERQF
ncbi:MAG: LamG domain-containing protein [Bacteroidota bacterium]